MEGADTTSTHISVMSRLTMMPRASTNKAAEQPYNGQ